MKFKFGYLLFGRRCVGCGKLIDLLSEENLCGGCLSNLTDISGNVYRVSDTDCFFAAYAYSGRMTHILRRIKSVRDDEACDVLARLLFSKMSNREEYLSADMVVCVPRYAKEGTRGPIYNLSAELARRVAGFIGAEFCPDVLVKRRNVRSQTSCSKRAVRLLNVKGAFDLNKEHDISGRRILLVDDIYTTGATLSECAGALRKGNPGLICAAAVAHGVYLRGSFEDFCVNKDDSVGYDISGMDMEQVRRRYSRYQRFKEFYAKLTGRKHG